MIFFMFCFVFIFLDIQVRVVKYIYKKEDCSLDREEKIEHEMLVHHNLQ